MVRSSQISPAFAAALLLSCASVGISQPQTPGGEATVTDFGALADGKTDNAPAFEKAWNSGAKVVFVPAGAFAVSKITVPEGATLEGTGNSSLVVPAAAAFSPLVTLSSDATVRRLKFVGHGAAIVCLRTGAIKNVAIQEVAIDDFKGNGIETDHTDDLTIEDCFLSHVVRATNIQFSHRVHVLNNTVTDCTEHGLQFWGNWKWETKQASDLFFMGNYVRDGGGAPIWGSGATHVVIANNIVDGASDVGLDLEWCDDSVISGNVVRRAFNSGISLFFACRRVAITGNTIQNDRPISAEEAKAGWWVRAGIWLTSPNRKEFPQDFGHRDIAITGNIIDCAEGKRRAIWIGGESDNVQLTGNVVRGGKVWRVVALPGANQPDTVINGDATIRNPVSPDALGPAHDGIGH